MYGLFIICIAVRQGRLEGVGEAAAREVDAGSLAGVHVVGQLDGEVVVVAGAPPPRVHEELAVVVGQGHLS